MKPRTELQKKVVELSKTLKWITPDQGKHAKKKCFTPYFALIRKTVYCLECGHQWKQNDSDLSASLIGETCPECGKKLKLLRDYKMWRTDKVYYGIIDVVQGFQVVRIFLVEKMYVKGEPASHEFVEVMQHWIDKTGEVVWLSMNIQGMSWYCDAWIRSSHLSVKSWSGYKAEARYSIIPAYLYPKRKVLPIIRRNGFKGYFYNKPLQEVFSSLLKDSHAETLIKAGQIALFTYNISNSARVSEYWSSIKICLRNKYVVNDPKLYFDYLNMIEQLGRDLRSPKYVCPDDLTLAHDRADRKLKEIRRKEKLIALRESINESQVHYKKAKGKFFGIEIKDADLVIKPVKHVKEFMEIGDELNHCVFSSKYYKRVDSLILSAMIGGRPIETIEYNLRSQEIEQCRGKNNKTTEHHSRIVNAVKTHQNLITERM